MSGASQPYRLVLTKRTTPPTSNYNAHTPLCVLPYGKYRNEHWKLW